MHTSFYCYGMPMLQRLSYKNGHYIMCYIRYCAIKCISTTRYYRDLQVLQNSYDLDIGRIFAMQCSMHTFTTLPSNWYSIELYIPTIMKTVTVLARGKANVFCELIHLSSSWKLVKVGYKYFLYRSNEVI